LPEYLATYLRSAKFVEFANTNSAGAKMPRVMMDKFWQHQISLPNISKQLKFVEAYKQCKKQIEVHEKAAVALGKLLASLQHQAFTTGFNA
jgi:type I restriction enzyme S subunit